MPELDKTDIMAQVFGVSVKESETGDAFAPPEPKPVEDTRIEDLEAVVSALARKEPQKGRRETTNKTPSSGSSFGFVFLKSHTTISSGAGAVAWTSYDPSGIIGSKAKGVIIETICRKDGGDAGDDVVQLRTDSTYAAITVGKGLSELDQITVNQSIMNLSSNGTFDYYADNISDHNIKLVGYYT